MSTEFINIFIVYLLLLFIYMSVTYLGKDIIMKNSKSLFKSLKLLVRHESFPLYLIEYL